MKISRLRRTLAVFLSALMLMMCMPMSAFTAFAVSTVSVADIISGSVTQLNVGDTVDFDTATVSYDNTDFNTVSIYFDDFSISNHTKDSLPTSWINGTTFVDVSSGSTTEIGGTHGSYTADAYWAVDAIVKQSSYLCVLLRSDKDTTLGGSSFTYPETVEDISDVVSIELNAEKTQIVITVPDSDYYDYYYQTIDFNSLGWTSEIAQSNLDNDSKIGMTAGSTTFPASNHTKITDNTASVDLSGSTLMGVKVVTCEKGYSTAYVAMPMYGYTAKLISTEASSSTVISEITAITTSPDITAAKLTVGDTLPSFSPSSYTYADGSETWFSDTCWYTGENGPETYFSGTTVADGTNYYYEIGIHAPSGMTFDLENLVLPTGWTFDSALDESEIYVYYNVPVEASTGLNEQVIIVADGGKFENTDEDYILVNLTNGKLPEGTLANNIPTKANYVFGGWTVYSRTAGDYIPIDDTHKFTEDNIDDYDEIGVIPKWLYEATGIALEDRINRFKLIDGGKVFDLSSDDDFSMFYITIDSCPVKQEPSDVKVYSVGKDAAFDPSTAAVCDANTDVSKISNDYYFLWTFDLSDSEYGFDTEGDFDISMRSYTSTLPDWNFEVKITSVTSATLSWKIPVLEPITEITELTIDPDITASNYTLAAGTPPTNFTVTAKGKTSGGDTGDLRLLYFGWFDEDADFLNDTPAETIVEGSKYVPFIVLEAGGYPFASDPTISVDGFTNVGIPDDSIIALTTEAITAIAASTEYTITLNANGGSNSSGSTVKTNAEGKLESLPADPTASSTQYLFKGWYTAKTDGERVTTDTVFEADTTIYALWYDILTTQTTLISDAELVPASESSKETRYTFTLPELSDEEKAEGFKYVYSVYSLSPWDITTKADADDFVNRSNESSRSLCDAIRSKSDVNDIPENNTITVDTLSGVTLYKVSENYLYYNTQYFYFARKEFAAGPEASTEYTITLDANGGTLPEGTENTAETTEGKLSSLPTPTREGYTFAGWFDAATGGKEVTTATVFEADATIYAQWTKVVTTAPDAPSITVTDSRTGPVIKWDAVDGATSYLVFRADSETGAKTKLVLTSYTSFTDTTAKIGNVYYYWVVSYNSAISKSSGYSNMAEIYFTGLTLVAPRYADKSVNDSGVVIKWYGVPTATSYRVYRASSYSGTKTLLKVTGSTSYCDTTAEKGRSYYYWITAYNSNSGVASAYSKQFYVMVPVQGVSAEKVVPLAPYITNRDATASGAVLKWSEVYGATSYTVYRADTYSGTKTKLKVTGYTSFCDTTAKAGKSYYYWVVANNSHIGKTSPYSKQAYVTMES